MHHLKYSVLPDNYAVCRLAPDAVVPDWGLESCGFCSVTHAHNELSIVCPEKQVPPEIKSERGWFCLRLEGPFPFSQSGVLASFIGPLSTGGIPIFAISTFDTDYVLIKTEFRESALLALREAGHELLTHL